MSDENQTLVPVSFIELYVAPGQIKPRIPKQEVAERYELCEDLSQLLVETASNMLHAHHITEADVLTRCKAGLLVEDPIVSPDEATWVIRRLAELMNWPPLSDEAK